MEIYELVILAVGLALTLVLLIKRQWRSCLVSAGLGLVSLLAVNLFSFVTGASVPLTFQNLTTAVLLGMPGVIFRLFMGII